MGYVLQVDFPYTGPWGDEMTQAMKGLASSIIQEPGLVWKIWTENQTTQEAGGIYFFKDKDSAKAYLTMHTARLNGFGITEVNGKIFKINKALSMLNRAPFDQED